MVDGEKKNLMRNGWKSTDSRSIDRTHFWFAGSGRVIITPPGHPTLMIEPLDVKVSSWTVPHDSLIIYIYNEDIDMFVPWVGVADDANCADLMGVMFGSRSIDFQHISGIRRTCLHAPFFGSLCIDAFSES